MAETNNAPEVQQDLSELLQGRREKLAALQGEQSASAAQEQGQEQRDQLAASPGPAASGSGALALFPALRIAAGLAHRAGPQAGAPLMYPFSGAGHVLFPASGSVALHVFSLPFRCD